MSAINYLKLRDELHFFADGASYREDGTIVHISDKLRAIPHLPCVLGARGPSWAGAILAEEFGTRCRSFDELIENIEEMLPRLFDHHHDMLLGGGDLAGTEVYIGGWSERRAAAVVYSIANFDRRRRHAEREGEIPKELRIDGIPGPFELLEMTGKCFIAPNLEGDALEQALGDITIDKLPNLDVFFLAVLELQRERKLALFPDMPAAHFVGGHAQVVNIVKSNIHNRIIKRWPDEAGKVIEPEPIDWAAWRAEHVGARRDAPEPPANLSRVRREMMARKERKAARRTAS